MTDSPKTVTPDVAAEKVADVVLTPVTPNDAAQAAEKAATPDVPKK
jgi:hypothetical protein